jgi:hypothetical protein
MGIKYPSNKASSGINEEKGMKDSKANSKDTGIPSENPYVLLR